LQRLKVWRVREIKLRRHIGAIEGLENSGEVVFRDTDTILDIYLPINPLNFAITNYHLSQEFIKHCGIINPQYQLRVQNILGFPITHLPILLESLDLDLSVDSVPSPIIPDTINHNLEEQDPLESPAQTQTITSALRSRIPNLDQSLAAVRQAAAAIPPTSGFTVFTSGIQPSTSSTAIAEGSGRSIHELLGSDTRDPEGHSSDVNALRRAVHGSDTESSVFGLEALHSALPDLDGTSATSPGGHQSQISGSHATSASVNSGTRNIGVAHSGANENNSVQNLYNRHIGLLGEFFVTFPWASGVWKLTRPID
jgi:hypothetical protein